MLSTALPIEIFGDTGAPAPRPLSRSASQAGNGAKESENQGFLRSTDHLMAADAALSEIDPKADIAFARLGWTEPNNAIRRASGTKQTSISTLNMSAFGGKADISDRQSSARIKNPRAELLPGRGTRDLPVAYHRQARRPRGRPRRRRASP